MQYEGNVPFQMRFFCKRPVLDAIFLQTSRFRCNFICERPVLDAILLVNVPL